jgi:beta-lactamase class D
VGLACVDVVLRSLDGAVVLDLADWKVQTMTEDQIIELARKLGWNVEHAETNRMLVLFARDIEDRIRSQTNRRSTDEIEGYAV